MFNKNLYKKKILIVDDDSRVRGLLMDLLGDTYQCTATSSPAEALEFVAGGSYPLVITDVEMPEFSGIELCKRIREASPSTVVIVVSGNPDEVIRSQALAAGATAFIPKPFDLFDLEASVKSSISRSEFLTAPARVRTLNFTIALDA
jgi:two-component system response regulator MprA